MGPRALVPGLMLALGCAHAAPPAVASPAVCLESAPIARSTPEAVPVARSEPRWRLRTHEDGPWSPLPKALHLFTVGRWECALGAAQAGARKLACTHASGATVQTRVSCPDSELTLDREPTFSIGCEPS